MSVSGVKQVKPETRNPKPETRTLKPEKMDGMKTIKFLLIVLIGVGTVCACSSKIKKKAIELPKFIVFRTDDDRPVQGQLFYKQIKTRDKDAIVIQGDLVLLNLKGWHTKEPVPLYSYLDKYKTVYSYWAGDAKSICYIPVTLIIRNVHIEKFDLEKLKIEYLNERIADKILLSSDTLANRKYFKASYNSYPMSIEFFKLVERKGLNIRHGIEIQAIFPRIVEENETLLKQT